MKKISLIVLAIVAITALVAMAMLFKHAIPVAKATEKLSITGQAITITPEEACSIVNCKNGEGAVFVGWRDTYARCVCPEHIAPANIIDFSNQRRGFDNPGNWNRDHIWLINTQRKY